MLRNAVVATHTSLTNLFNKSLSTGVFPADRKFSNITPVFKGKGNNIIIIYSVLNYRPISFLSLPSKILERIIHNCVMDRGLSNNNSLTTSIWFPLASSTQEALPYVTKTGMTIWRMVYQQLLCFSTFLRPLTRSLNLSLSPLYWEPVAISGSLLEWSKNYLSDHLKDVLNGHSSVFTEVSSMSSWINSRTWH